MFDNGFKYKLTNYASRTCTDNNGVPLPRRPIWGGGRGDSREEKYQMRKKKHHCELRYEWEIYTQKNIWSILIHISIHPAHTEVIQIIVAQVEYEGSIHRIRGWCQVEHDIQHRTPPKICYMVEKVLVVCSAELKWLARHLLQSVVDRY